MGSQIIHNSCLLLVLDSNSNFPIGLQYSDSELSFSLVSEGSRSDILEWMKNRDG